MAGGARFEPPDAINTKLSRQVSQAIEHAMQVRQANRPQSMAAWQKELEAAREATISSLPHTISSPTIPPPVELIKGVEEGRPIVPVSSPKGGLPWLWIGLGVVFLVVILAVMVGAIALSFGRGGGVETDATVAAALEATVTEQAKAKTPQLTNPPVDTPVPTLSDNTPVSTPLPPTATPILQADTPTPTPLPPINTPTPPPTATPSQTPTSTSPAQPSQIPEGWAYGSNLNGNWDLHIMENGRPRRLTEHPAMDCCPLRSPDGSKFAIYRRPQDTNGDGLINIDDDEEIWIVNFDGSNSIKIETKGNKN